MREIKAVSFNVEDFFEKKLFQYAIEQGSFSRYVKRLIFLDMENKSNSKAIKKSSQLEYISDFFKFPNSTED